MRPVVLVLLLLLVPVQGAFAAREYPVDGGTVTSGIGWRLDPFGSGQQFYHHGIDIAVPEGTPVHPTESGVVIYTGPYGGYGNTVVVDHGTGRVTIYGHNGEIRVKNGEKVSPDSVIALSGNTGRSTGPHVHYEVRRLAGNAASRKRQLVALMKEAMEENLNQIMRSALEGGMMDAVILPPPQNPQAAGGR